MRRSRINRLKPGRLSSSKAFRRILVAVDESESSFRAAKYAISLAKTSEAELIVIFVIQRPVRPFMPISAERPRVPRLERYYAYASKNAEHWVHRVVALARSSGVSVRARVLRGTSIVKEVTDYAAGEGVDLIVVGRKGASGFKRLLLGSVSNGVVNHAPSTVLVVQ